VSSDLLNIQLASEETTGEATPESREFLIFIVNNRESTLESGAIGGTIGPFRARKISVHTESPPFPKSKLRDPKIEASSRETAVEGTN